MNIDMDFDMLIPYDSVKCLRKCKKALRKLESGPRIQKRRPKMIRVPRVGCEFRYSYRKDPLVGYHVNRKTAIRKKQPKIVKIRNKRPLTWTFQFSSWTPYPTPFAMLDYQGQPHELHQIAVEQTPVDFQVEGKEIDYIHPAPATLQ